MKKKEFRVKVDMSVGQANVVLAALDLYSRLHMGQVDNVEMFYRLLGIKLNKTNQCRTVSQLCDDIKANVFPELSRDGFYGITSDKIHDDARVAWDLIQAMRRPIAWKQHPEGGMTVDFDAPLKTSGVDLAKVEVE